ncbi:GNAT family N-acetyltransferase [Terrabacter sp. LjRoot27]|uniref:GNAT family N-acetyltransferase n=1 Tax=Terrabacter sp. LjRoot27 TaxID=3342306 RepID=UPI003ECED7BE
MTEQTGEGRIVADGEHDGIEVLDNPERGRFELRDGDHVIGVASYAVVPGATPGTPARVVFFHTEVSPAYEGRGLAGRLAAYALDATVAAGRSIVALCPYIKVYLRRHPEPYAARVLAPTRDDVDAAERAAAAR